MKPKSHASGNILLARAFGKLPGSSTSALDDVFAHQTDLKFSAENRTFIPNRANRRLIKKLQRKER